MTQKGVDGSSFNNDLLHLIGFEADSKEAYLQLYTYYNKVGNRGRLVSVPISSSRNTARMT